MKLQDASVCILFCILLNCSSCTFKHYPVKIIDISRLEPCQLPSAQASYPPITIWVHGTFFFTNHALPRFIRCPKGLTHISHFGPKTYYQRLAHSLVDIDSCGNALEEFYVFGWSGKLSFHARKQAAHELYQALLELIEKYREKYGKPPFIRIITHSHGGNVALKTAALKHHYSDIHIDELILLACPVQHETKYLIHDPMFKKIISLFSTLDIVQVMDPQGIYPKTWHAYDLAEHHLAHQKRPIFSERIFPISKTITQARLVKNHRGLFHIEFMLPNFLKKLPTITQIL